MRAYVDLWLIPANDDDEPDPVAILNSIRALPNAVLADRFFGNDLIVVIEASVAALHETVAAIEKIDSALSISSPGVRLARDD